MAKSWRAASEAVLQPMSEEERAAWLDRRGAHIVQRHGRYWRQLWTGFYQPVHLLARLEAQQAQRPDPWCWGYRAALCEDATTAGTSSIPVHLLSDVRDYDERRLSSNRRYHLRKCRRQVEMVELLDSSLLTRQGHEVHLSVAERTRYIQPREHDEYVARLATYVDPPRRLVLAGLLDSKLGGYLSGYAVDGTAYIERLHVATEALTTNISLGLIQEFIQACQRSTAVHEIVHSLHTPEDAALEVFKKSVGFPIVPVPSKAVLNPVAAWALRRRKPYVFYRLTGRGGAGGPAPGRSAAQRRRLASPFRADRPLARP